MKEDWTTVAGRGLIMRTHDISVLIIRHHMINTCGFIITSLFLGIFEFYHNKIFKKLNIFESSFKDLNTGPIKPYSIL